MSRQEIVNEFLNIVFGTLETDLKQMMSQPQGLDFGMIALICGGIELLGALDRWSIGNCEDRFAEALQKYFPGRYSEYTKTLYRLFRHGLAHHAFIKPGTATSRNPDLKHCHLWGVSVDGEIALFVHPDVFAQDFFKAVEGFREALRERPRKVEIAYQTIDKFYKTRQYIGESPEIPTCLPDDGLNMTRMPLPSPKSIARSEARVGSIVLEENDNQRGGSR
jgi:hypothetical protein